MTVQRDRVERGAQAQTARIVLRWKEVPGATGAVSVNLATGQATADMFEEADAITNPGGTD